jgi:membrane associated rhomboid family serine protease
VSEESGETRRSERIFNVPAVVLAVVAACVVVHVVRVYWLTDAQDDDFLGTFAFIPARYDHALALRMGIPDSLACDAWTFVTYAFIHGSWMHLAVNSIWLLPFGSALARRFGSVRFLAFFAATAVAGALAHLATHANAMQPVIGASGAISGFMAASTRFAFQRGGPLSFFAVNEDAAYRVPAAPLSVALRDRRIVIFLGAWFGLNILFGLGTLAVPGMNAEQEVAWQAHIGGFLAGLLLFPLFDPVVAPPSLDGSGGEDAPPATTETPPASTET